MSLIAVSSTKCDFCLLKGYLVMFWGVQLPGSPTKILLKTSFVPKPSPSQKWATEASDEVSLALDLNSSFSSSNYQMVSVFCPGRSPFQEFFDYLMRFVDVYPWEKAASLLATLLSVTTLFIIFCCSWLVGTSCPNILSPKTCQLGYWKLPSH